MVFEYKNEGDFHKIPKLNPGPPNVYFGDVFATASQSDPNPLTGSMFLLEHADNDEPAPKYNYDETGVVIKGVLRISDEKRNNAELLPGDTFFIHRGSTITFSTPRFAIAYKCGARQKMH